MLEVEEATVAVVGEEVRWDVLHHQQHWTLSASLAAKQFSQSGDRNPEELIWRHTLRSFSGGSAGACQNAGYAGVFTAHSPRRAHGSSLGALRNNLWMRRVSGVAGAVEFSHLVAAGPRASPLFTFQLCGSQPHCRVTVPPIGSIAAPPQSVHMLSEKDR